MKKISNDERLTFNSRELISGKTIFFSSLDWGLGHATRSVPIIKGLLQNDNKIVLGVTPLTNPVFIQEFPELEKITVPSYNISYSSVLPLWFKLASDAPRILRVIKQENKFLEELISTRKIDVVISDNRFGLYFKNVRTVFITHQLFLKAPVFSSLAQQLNKKYILKFDEVWVPDYEDKDHCLSGELSHGPEFHPNTKYIGPQSRLIKYEPVEKKYDYLFLLSGPEPHQSILKKMLLQKVKQYPAYKFAMASTLKEEDYDVNLENFVSADPVTLSKLICESKTVICRSGYSTLMDLYLLNVKNVILIPTPGQTEQEYLAKFWKTKIDCRVYAQSEVLFMKL